MIFPWAEPELEKAQARNSERKAANNVRAMDKASEKFFEVIVYEL